MRNLAWKDYLPVFSDHPLIASGLILIFGVILLLGTLHAARLFIRFLVVLAEEMKHEVVGMGMWLRRLKDELTTWKSKP